MKICFNEATTMKYSTLEKDLEYCEKYGYDLIEIRIDKLKDYLKRNTVDDLVDFFRNSKIKPYAFNALEFINFRTKEQFDVILDDLEFICNIGKKIGCDKAVIVPTFDIGDYTVEEIKRETVNKINVLAYLAEKENFKLAFEFVGYPNCSVNTFGQAYDIVKEVNRDNVGIVLDCFHFHAMNSRISDLEDIMIDKLFIFHIDDAENLPFGALRDNNRLWPGDGSINLDLILKTLKDKKYEKYENMVSVELFRPEYWEWDIEKTIKIGKEKTVGVVSKYFKL